MSFSPSQRVTYTVAGVARSGIIITAPIHDPKYGQDVCAVAEDGASYPRQVWTSWLTLDPLFAAVNSPVGGISVGGGIQSEDVTTLGRDLDVCATAKAKLVRFDINWDQIQKTGSGSFDWSRQDALVAACTARGLIPHGMIAYTPPWARPAGASAMYGPDPALFATFAKAAAARYGPRGVRTFEIWNEPNTTYFWTPKPSASAYAVLLKAASAAIRSVDPSLLVISGGTSPAPSDGTQLSPVDFITGLYAAGAGPSFDALAHHPYCWPAFPGSTDAWSAWYQMTGAASSIRTVMTANGDSAKKVWATEFGAPSAKVFEQTEADMITKAFQLWRTYAWAGPLCIYRHRDDDPGGDTYGLVRGDFSAKPALAAYQAVQ